MDLSKNIKSKLTSSMSKVNHINKSKDLSKLTSMIQEKVTIGKEEVYEILDEVMTIKGDVDEIRFSIFGSRIGHIEDAAKDFIEILNEKMPKLRVKHVDRLVKLLDKVENEIRKSKEKLTGENEVEILNKVKNDLKEMTGASSAGSFLGPLFSEPIRRTMPGKPKNKKKYDVKEQKGYSPWLVDKDNPKGETDGLTPDVLQKIFSKIVADFKTENPEENYYEEPKKDGDINEKWSEEYKKSIDCDNPKGFSQKAHCQGKTKKQETKEATLSSSSGSYETPLFLAKDAKNWRGAAKTLYKGGKFVKIKDKCKTFPYCNQGDIKALELFENGKYSKLSDKVAEKMGQDPIKVKSLILNDLEESLFRKRMKQKSTSNVYNSEKNNRIGNK